MILTLEYKNVWNLHTGISWEFDVTPSFKMLMMTDDSAREKIQIVVGFLEFI